MTSPRREISRLRPTLAARLAAEWKWKLAGIPGFLALFFAAYFLLLRFPVFPVTTIPLTRWDHWIPFQPATLGLYFSLWFYVALEPSLLTTRGELIAYLKRAALLALVGLAVFFFWPTSTPVPVDIVWAEHPGFAFLKEVDRAQNACPSLHVAFAVFAAVRLWRLFGVAGASIGWQLAMVGWGAGIVYSTVATRQHVVIDVIAGAVLGAVMAMLPDQRRKIIPAEAAQR